MKVYALLHCRNSEQFSRLLAVYKEFSAVHRCLVWADNLDGIETKIVRLREETQCREIILATSLFQSDCEHPAPLDKMLSQERIDILFNFLEKYQPYIQGVMFGNAGGETAARSLAGYEADRLSRYVVEILEICRGYAEKTHQPQWAGVMDGEVVIDSYHYRDCLEKSPLYNYLINSEIINVIFCGYQMCYPIGDARRNIAPRAIYTQVDIPGEYPYEYFRRYIRQTKMLSGSGHCYGVIHGSLPVLKQAGYVGAVLGFDRIGLDGWDWSEVVAKVNEQVIAVQA